MTDREAGPETPPLLTERRGPVLLLTLNRPERLNAVSLPVYEALLAALRAAEADAEVRVVVLTGAGRGFCAGADLKAHADGPPTGETRRRYVRTAQQVNRRIQRGAVPVVAAVNGPAVGAGLELALSADFMLVAEDATLRLPEVALGTFVGGGVVYTLAERIGVLRARELIYLGEPIRGRDAAAMGMANRALPTDRVLEAALELAGRLAERAPLSLAAAKRLVGFSAGMSRSRALKEEARTLERLFGTEDWAEGVRAFSERRPPRFTGR
ncbi:MAG TPA: enoyl-CoA hydratase-related protein [Longimicrobiales bacterium]|nr:enoyl-CoA hydratase-related protein [Longimicrobiales bacterium]